MKKYLAAMCLTGLLAVTAGGCVSQEEYDKTVAQLRNAEAQLSTLHSELDARKKRIDELQNDIAALNSQLKAKDGQIDLLTAALQQARADLAALQGKTVVLPPPPKLTALPSDVNEALGKWARLYPDILDYDPATGMVKFKSDMTFDPGSDVVKPKAKEALQKLAEILNMPEAAPFNAYIAGHTDDMKISRPETKKVHPNNWYLSVHRAVAVEEVIESAKVQPVRLSAMGFGEHHPVAANKANNGGNELNRRVEIWIVPPERFLTVSGGKVTTAKTPAAPTAPAVPAN